MAWLAGPGTPERHCRPWRSVALSMGKAGRDIGDARQEDRIVLVMVIGLENKFAPIVSLWPVLEQIVEPCCVIGTITLGHASF